MKKNLTLLFFCSLLGLNSSFFAQNQATKWYFGTQAGLDFMTSPPTIIANSAMSSWEGCASIGNAAGNLLFYTDGITVYNANNVAMANGTGLLGDPSSTQSGVIIQKPGSNSIYYIFTLGASVSPGPLSYSEVDMTLSAGLGSVTVLNTPLFATSSEKLTAVRHCNGTDAWAISHDMNTNNFRAYLITSGGVNLTPVVSAVGPVYTDARGYLKASPNGTKLGLGDYSSNTFAIYNFDASTGVVSNEIVLGNHPSPYGFEFSPDGTKCYGACEGADYRFYQWDLCAGSATAIAASEYTTATTSGVQNFALQTAPNGKVYMARISTQDLGVINNPNVYGSGMNFVNLGQSIAPGTCALGLPNFITSLFNVQSPPFSFTTSALNPTVGCQSAQFSAPVVQGYTSCVGGSTVTGFQWIFGDPASGAANTSTLTNPTHQYSSQGTFTPKLVYYYSNFCGNVTDTVSQSITFNQPCVSYTSNVSCAGLGTATVQGTSGTGPFSYTWMPSGQTTSIATNLVPGTYTVTVLNLSTTYSYVAYVTLSPTLNFTGNLSNSSAVLCNGSNTGTASITMSGGSGNQYYYWTNLGIGTQTTATASGLGAGSHTVTVIDALTSCKYTQAFTILTPQPLAISIAVSSPTACAGNKINFNATTTGGTPAYSYTWTGGIVNPRDTVSETLPGVHSYTVVSSDANNCIAARVVTVNFIANPVVIVTSVSVCPMHTGVIVAAGANTYTWTSSGLVSPSFAAAPAQSTAYSVIGQVGDCISVPAWGSIMTLNPAIPTATNSGPVCNGQELVLGGSGSSNYYWTGPFNFNRAGQTLTMTANNTAYSGNFTLTTYDANGCKGEATTYVTVYTLPVIHIGKVKTSGCAPFCSVIKSDEPESDALAIKGWTLNSAFFPVSSFSYCFNQPSTYHLKADVVNPSTQCANTLSFVVNAYPQPTANFDFSPDKAIENQDEVVFTSTSKGNQLQQWNWYFASNNGHTATGPSTSYVFDNVGVYPIAHTVTDVWGCMDTVVKTIVVDPDFQIYFPNAFTPNSDDKNETFQAKGNGVVSFNMKIFNRWGELVFESNEITKGWDGTYKGIMCQNGEYIWKATVTSMQQKVKALSGTVMLYR